MLKGLFRSKEEREQIRAEKLAKQEARFAAQRERERDFETIVADFAKGEYKFNSFLAAGDGSAGERMSTGLILKGSEELIFESPSVSLIESRSVRTGAYGGPRVRIAKGITIGGGAFRAESHDEMRTVDSGEFAITSERVVFSGGSRTQVIQLKKIVNVEPVDGTVGINHAGKQKTQYFQFPEIRATFNVEGRTYPNEPISARMVAALLQGVVERAITN